MGRRYAVLWTLDHEESLPIGIAVEEEGFVLVDVPEHLCIPARQRGEYRVVQPDSSHLTYRPGDPGHFDQVILDLSRTFAIGEQGEISGDDTPTVLDLLRRKVIQPLQSATVVPYSRPSHVRYHAVRDVSEREETPATASPMPVGV